MELVLHSYKIFDARLNIQTAVPEILSKDVTLKILLYMSKFTEIAGETVRLVAH
jgi:hypothetical protein